MSTTFPEDLGRHLGNLLNETETVSDFRHWFSRAWWESESSANDSIFDLASAIEHYTYILDDGVWDERVFREKVAESWWEYKQQRARHTVPIPSGAS